MLRKLASLVYAIRPAQAYKVGIVWLPALFHGHGSLRDQAGVLALASLAWLLGSGVVYLLNDLKDASSDRQRSDRVHRPIAQGIIKPWEALVFAVSLLVALSGLLCVLPGRISILLALYAILNIIYTYGLKESLGLRQAIIALGFWFRLQSGAEPVTTIPLTPWASLFTLGLAYQLNCLKGIASFDQDHHRGYRFAMGMGAGLAGSVALASLIAICLKRGIEGTMQFPELPPLFCLVGMHRVAFTSFKKDIAKEQSRGFFFDPITLITIVLFTCSFVYL